MGFYKNIVSFEQDLSDTLTNAIRTGYHSHEMTSQIEISEYNSHRYAITYTHIRPNYDGYKSYIEHRFHIEKKQLVDVYSRYKKISDSYITFSRTPSSRVYKINLWTGERVKICSYRVGVI